MISLRTVPIRGGVRGIATLPLGVGGRSGAAFAPQAPAGGASPVSEANENQATRHARRRGAGCRAGGGL